MANITLSVPDELRERMREHPDVRWSAAFAQMVERKLDDFEVVERLVQKSRLTEEDAARMAAEVRAAGGRHMLELLKAKRKERGNDAPSR